MKKILAWVVMISLVASNAFGFGAGTGWYPPAGPSDGQMLAWDSATNSVVWTTGTGTGDLLAGTMGAAGSICVNTAVANTLDCNVAQATFEPDITFGTGVLTALGVNVGSVGAPVINGGALGTPSSGTLTNCTFPTLNQNTSGTAAGLSGTPNITVGTVSAGAGGMLVDADGDTTVKSIAIAASAAPGGGYMDSDAPGADKEVAFDGAAYVDGADGSENGTRDLYVHEGGTRTSYIQLDGKNVQVEINKPVTLGANNFVTTGSMSAGIPSVADADAHSVTGAEAYGYMGWATGAGTWTLPAAVAGMNLCVYSTTAAAIVINPDDADVIVLNGTALSAGDSITSASGAGDFICIVARDGTNWHTLGRSGTWTDTN
jgi:hypothetical protein